VEIEDGHTFYLLDSISVHPGEGGVGGENPARLSIDDTKAIVGFFNQNPVEFIPLLNQRAMMFTLYH
jgi:hypothetical protein